MILRKSWTVGGAPLDPPLLWTIAVTLAVLILSKIVYYVEKKPRPFISPTLPQLLYIVMLRDFLQEISLKSRKFPVTWPRGKGAHVHGARGGGG